VDVGLEIAAGNLRLAAVESGPKSREKDGYILSPYDLLEVRERARHWYGDVQIDNLKGHVTLEVPLTQVKGDGA
jgi:hypothetical protein